MQSFHVKGNLGNIDYDYYTSDNLQKTIVSETHNSIWVVQSLQQIQEDNSNNLSYLNKLNDYIKQNISNTDTTLREHMKNAVFHMMDTFSDEIEDKDLDNAPGAVLTLLRYNEREQNIEYFSIGDIPLLIEHEKKTTRICATDASSYKPDFNPDDQWCLSFNPDAIDYARVGCLSLDDVDRFSIFTMAFDQTLQSKNPSESSAMISDGSVESIFESVTSNIERHQLWRQDNTDSVLVYAEKVGE